jgi:hypothetical protein
MRLALRQASLLVTTAGLIRLPSQTNKSPNRRGRLPGGLKAFGHTVRLLPPAYVKPYVKRQKACGFDDSADQTPVVQHRKVGEVD